jgi:hypothetical protein
MDGNVRVAIHGAGELRDAELRSILARAENGEWSGMREVTARNRWTHVRNKASDGVSPVSFIEEAMAGAGTTAIVVKTGSGVPTACVLMHLDVDGGGVLEAACGLAHITLLSTCDDAPKGHATRAMAEAMQLARRSGKGIVYLRALSARLAYYMNVCFGRGVHALLVQTEELFERSRAYALASQVSGRDGQSIGCILDEAGLLPVVAFALHGRDALARLDYGELAAGGPKTEPARMRRVSADAPLVVGHSYEVALATSVGAAEGLVGDGAERRYGRRKLAGSFVRVVGRANARLANYTVCSEEGASSWGPGEVAVFENGLMHWNVGIRFDAGIAFRRTMREHMLFEPVQADPEEEFLVGQLPDA